jgi:hypothetical protein
MGLLDGLCLGLLMVVLFVSDWWARADAIPPMCAYLPRGLNYSSPSVVGVKSSVKQQANPNQSSIVRKFVGLQA